jgi:hypothetical protein
VEGHAQSAKPGGAPISTGRFYIASRPDADGRLSAPDEKQDRAGGATTATAHKIAIIFYAMVKRQVEYDASIWAERDAEREKRFEAKLKRQAHQLGYKLVPIEEKPAA